MKLYTTNEVAKQLNLHPTTLLSWIKAGFVNPTKLPTGRYRWTENDINQLLSNLNIHDNVSTIPSVAIYARISQPAKEHLDNQLNLLKHYTVSKGWVINYTFTDISSSFNFNRPGLNKLIKLIFQYKITDLIIYSPDRLSRIAFDLFKNICKYFNVSIHIVINEEKPIEKWQQDDLYEELISFLHYITSKIYGSRSYKNKLKELKSEITNEYKK